MVFDKIAKKKNGGGNIFENFLDGMKTVFHTYKMRKANFFLYFCF